MSSDYAALAKRLGELANMEANETEDVMNQAATAIYDLLRVIENTRDKAHALLKELKL